MMWCFVFIFMCIQRCTPQFIYTETREISYQIAGIFEREAHTQRLAFNESMRHVYVGDFRLDPQIISPAKTDSYSVYREFCSNTDMRPIAVFGPQNPLNDQIIRDQCAAAHIPYIQATWQPSDPTLETVMDAAEEEAIEETEDEEEEITDDDENEETPASSENIEHKKISINFYPDPDEISLAYARLLDYYNWENFAVLYEDDFGLLRVEKILAEHTEYFPVTVRRLDPDKDNRNVFKELKEFQESRVLIDCHVDRILKYMDEAAGLNMTNFYQHYILTSLDTYVVAERLTKLNSNVTWLSITEYDKLKDAQHFLAPRVGKWNGADSTASSVTHYEIEALIMDDVANHLLKAFQSIELDKIEVPYNHICEEDAEPWAFGPIFQDQILKTNSTGVTGYIEFDENGKRINYTLYVNEIHESTLNTIGTWDPLHGDAIVEHRSDSVNVGTQQSSKHFIVISRKAKPYFYDKTPCPEDDEDCVEETNDEKYEGFSVDLVWNIFHILRTEGNFNYTYSFHHDEDKEYGKYDPVTKKWNGLIGDLLDKKADLAVCDLTITEERKKVVDFSVPFMTLGISILYTKEHEIDPELFSFLNPYTFEVWMHIATAYCVVSIILFVCARISPADWENPQPCDKDPEELENIWNFKNCAWLTMGSIMTQGCDILPKAIGTRWVCGMWWFFAVIVCQTYIAQLSASMTSAMEDTPIDSADTLATQTKILYGAIEGGSTLGFFKKSKDKTYKKIYDNIMANPAVLVKSNDEGEKRVLDSQGKYAFFMESCTIEYKLKRRCNLKKVGGELDSKDYGIAMPANSPFRTHINRAILRLHELTTLDAIKDKWWERKYGAVECEAGTDANDVEGDLELKHLNGAFLVLGVGLVFCLFITAAEFMNEVRNIVVREQVPHKEVIIKELKSSLNFFQLQKPVIRNPSRAPSIAESSMSKQEEKMEKRAAVIENFLDFEKEPQ